MGTDTQDDEHMASNPGCKLFSSHYSANALWEPRTGRGSPTTQGYPGCIQPRISVPKRTSTSEGSPTQALRKRAWEEEKRAQMVSGCPANTIVSSSPNLKEGIDIIRLLR